MLPIHAARIAAGARVVDSKRRKTLGMNAPDEHGPEKEDCGESHLPNLAVIQCSPQCLVFVIGDVLREVQKR